MKQLLYTIIKKICIYIINFFIFFLFIKIFVLLISYYDTRYAKNGKLHDDFTIVVFENKSFFPLELSKLKNIPTNDKLFISDIDSAEKKWNINGDTYVTFSYTITKGKNEDQVETVLKDPDRTVWSTYKVVNETIIPIKSRLYTFDYLPLATFLAFITTWVLNFMFKFLKINKFFENYCNNK